MQKFYIAVFLSLFVILPGCKKKKPVKEDSRSTQTSQSLPDEVKTLDSTLIAQFISVNNEYVSFGGELHEFYQNRNFEYAWFDKYGITTRAEELHSIVSSTSTSRLDSLIALFNDSKAVKKHIKLIPEAELLLSSAFFAYAKKEYVGQNVDTWKYSWKIPRKKLDLSAHLNKMAEANSIANYPEPVHYQYPQLKHYLSQYAELQKKHNFKPLSLSDKLEVGDSSAIIPEIKNRLYFFGDLPSRDNTSTFSEAMLTAVKRFQARHGLTVDGVIGKGFMAAINTPVTSRIQSILVNMERARWLPIPKGDFFVVNIPEFMLHIYDNEKHWWSTPVIVGKKSDQTVIFTESLKYVVFAPYWNIPNSIVQKELLSEINSNSNYLAENNMEWVGDQLRQLPGDDNALGKVKFLFPNRYNIYLHDTPAKTLFDQTKRAYSHGCIRVKEPEKLAQFLFRKDKAWTADSIRSAMSKTEEMSLSLRSNPQVYIVYFTAFVDPEGKLNFREDIYGHDKKMEKLLFPKGN